MLMSIEYLVECANLQIYIDGAWTDMKIRNSIRSYINGVRKYLWVIGIVALASFLLALILKFKVEDDIYNAYATVFSVSAGSYTESAEGVAALKTYSDIITSRKVADRAALIIGDDKITGDTVQEMTSYTYADNSTVYYIYAESTDSDLAIMVANAVAKAFVIEVNNITGEENAQILDESYEAKLQFDGRKAQIEGIMKITGIGTLVALFLVLAYFIISGKTVSVSDASLNGNIEILGVIPDFDVE